MTAPRMLCFGHRGARGHEPENTLLSIRKAIELGADGVEVDVHFVDGELMVIHDDTLERTTNGHGRLKGKSFAWLRALDAGKGECIPTLAEVFELVNRRVVINVELKGEGTAIPVAGLIADYVIHHGWKPKDFLVSSFDYQQLKTVKLQYPELRLGVLTPKASIKALDFAGDLGAWSVNPGYRNLTAGFVEKAHDRGLKVIVYTVNAPGDIARCLALGVDGVFCDYPERVAG